MRLPGFSSRRPVRLRLTLIYSSLFLLAGVALLSVSYGLVAGVLPSVASRSQVSDAIAKASSAGPNAPTVCKKNKLSKPVDPCESAASSPVAPSPKICASKGLSVKQEGLCKEQAQAALQALADATVQGERSQTLHRLLDDSAGALALVTLISALLGWVVAGRALRPVHAITAAARRASEENLSERIALTGPSDELKELADTFDGMLARLDSAFASQRRFVANASHELRTPLTVMRTAIDVTLAKPARTPGQLEAMATEVRQAVDRAEVLIEALLTLARSDRGPGPRSALDLAVFAEDALDAAAPAISATSITVDSALEPGTATGDPVLVERLVANLIDNSVRHNTQDGWIQVRTGHRDGMAFISVANSGPVIDDSAVASLFEPFHRGSQHSGPGTGLGLSIVRSVAAAHQGRIAAQPVPHGGLEITVLLPLG